MWLAHPRWDVALAVQNTPNINVIVTLDEKDQIRVAFQRPGSEARQMQVMGIAGRSGRRMAGDVPVRLLQGIDETECCLLSNCA